MSLLVIKSKQANELLDHMLEAFQVGKVFSDKHFVITASLDEWGRDNTIYDYLKQNPDDLRSGYGALLITSPNELYTKEYAKEVIHLLNLRGVEFPGHSVVEAIAGLKNMRKWATFQESTLEQALYDQANRLGERLATYSKKPVKRLLVLHANSRPDRSNTMQFFREVEKHLSIDYVNVEVLDEHVADCAGCSYKTCGYYSQIQSCYFGGIFTEQVLQQVDQAGAVLLLAPNYNDALSAKMMAVANRLSVLYRRGPFYDKYLFALIVSGNSGSDSVARQMIGAFHINKGFRLPAVFYQQSIANDPGEITTDPDFTKKAEQFAQTLNDYLR